MAEKTSFDDILVCGRNILKQAGIEDWELDAWYLLGYITAMGRAEYFLRRFEIAPENVVNEYYKLISIRASHVPLQHITGNQEFMGLDFLVSPDVLVPRQDTEILVEEVLRNLHDGMRILDLCTGSGCILLSLLRYSNGCTGIGTDLSAEALKVAERNACRIIQRGMDDEPSVMFKQSDLFQELDQREKFDIIVSNPPYIRANVIETLMPEVRDHEPLMALDGREDGLFFYRRIIAQADAYLSGGGMLFLEIGFDQGEDVSRLMEEAGYMQIEVFQDYAGHDRVVQGVWGFSGAD